MKKIPPSDLVVLDDYAKDYPLRVDTVYAKAAHKDNMFKQAIYKPSAPMPCHVEFLPIILRASVICHEQSGYYFELKDCLRPFEAQQKIIDTEIVRAHPQWLEEPRLFSPPGKGGHPRGMAVDIILVEQNGNEIDMGTPFDYLTADKSDNPAARDYVNFGKCDETNRLILKNRALLTDAMRKAAQEEGREIIPLPQEWWDFRFPNEYTALFAPVHDADLPLNLRMMR